MHPLLSSFFRQPALLKGTLLLIAASIAIADVAGVRLLDALELKTYDMRLIAAASERAPDQVAIVAMTEKSLSVAAPFVQNLLDGTSGYRPAWLKLAEIVSLIMFGLLLALVLPQLNARNAAMLCAALFFSHLIVAVAAFRLHLWINVVYPALLLLLAALSCIIMRNFVGKSRGNQG